MSNVYIATNRELWNLWTKFNAKSKEYGDLLEKLKASETTLKEIELEELGNVSGKTLLHLQCHFGLDTLSWAKEGAIVTGIDISDVAITQARSLSQELNIKAEFICSDIYNLPTVLDKRFHIVYTSGGVLCWLPDLDRWARLITRYLKPGGTVYIMEGHPIVRAFKPRTDGQGNPVEWGYFDRGPIRVEERRSNGNSMLHPSHVACYWPHSLGEIISALCSAGLRLEFLHEFPETVEIRSYEEIEPSQYELRVHRTVVIPGFFSIRAVYQ
ncbi:MAG: class I SAM-dependent methyltransferase [Anaerolineae bacterium]|nr:class I SAM-dependent methyltransferase [Anaerolineae bacterium]